MEDPMSLEIINGRVFLDGMEIRDINSYKLENSADSSEENDNKRKNIFYLGGNKMENVDKVIEVLCEDICKNREGLMIEDLCGLIEALADLVVAKSKMKQSETDINEMAFRISSKFSKQIEESKAGSTKVKQDISDKKRNKPSIEVDIKVEHMELDEAIEKANQLIELLREAQKIVDSLSGKKCTSDKDHTLEAFILASKEIMESESLV